LSWHAHRESGNEQYMLRVGSKGRHGEKLVRVLPCLMYLIFLPGCDFANNPQANAMIHSTMVAGPGETTFAAKYNLDIHLPMGEDEFLQILRRLRLHYQICGRRNTDIGLPPARHDTSIDMTQAETCYEIYGDHRLPRGAAEAWRAFSDQQHRIFYVETAYAYPAP
jgi:hypothetical protein